MSETYNFNFAWASPYGHVVRMLSRLSSDAGVILDIGCGHGAIAEPLRERGYEYLGCDLDKGAVEDLHARGFEAHELDLNERIGLTDRLVEIADGRRVAGLVMLDTIEHLPDTSDFVGVLRKSLLALGRPTLVVSVPNVAHFDLGVKLLMGRWDYTATGLLDITHVSFFTEERLTDELRKGGLAEILRDDFSLIQSDQHFPADHPALVNGSPLSMLLWQLRRQADSSGKVNQFVRAYALTNLMSTEPPDERPQPFLSVLVRTQGLRLSSLIEALTCLGAQRVNDFEVIVLVHTDSGALVDCVGDLVASFDESFQYRVRVVQVDSGGRARPLNVGLGVAAGRYLAFLDEDDYVTADWVNTFRRGAEAHPGQIVRTVCVDRRVECLSGKDLVADWQPLGALEYNHCEEFDLLEHLNENRTPIHSFAIPLIALRALGLHFDESLPVVEDWDVLIRTASLTGVHDTRTRTAIYHRWVGGESSQTGIDHRVWSAARQVVLNHLDALPLLLPPGSATRIADCRLLAAHHQVEEPPTAPEPTPDYQALAEEHRLLQGDLQRAHTEIHRFESSEFWRVTAPFRRISAAIRRILHIR